MKKEYLNGVSDANLIQMYCNCIVTLMDTEQNSIEEKRNYSRHWLIGDEILRRDLKIPTNEYAKEKGILNGEGTF